MTDEDASSTESPAARPLLRVWREAGFWALVGSTLVYFLPTVALGQTVYMRDIYAFYLPLRRYVAEVLAAGHAPFWMAPLHGGQPLWSSPANQVLYPANLLYLVLDPLTALNLEVTLHIGLAALGTYALARVLGLRQSASVVAGAAFAFSGYTLSLVNNFARLDSLAPTPWVLLLWHLYWRDRRPRWALAAALVEVVQWLSGGAEYALLGLGTVMLWTLFYPYSQPGWRRRMVWFLVLQVLVCGVLAVQLVPAVPLVQDSVRAEGLGFARLTTWSLHPSRLPELVVPGFFGRTDTLEESDYWGRARVSGGFPYVLSLYLGPLPLALALVAVADRRRQALPRRIVVLLGMLSLGGAVLALGAHLPGFELLSDAVPLASAFRYPIKLLAVALLPLALLAASTTDAMLADSEEAAPVLRHAVAAVALVGTPLLTGALVLSWLPATAEALEQLLFGASSAAISDGLTLALTRAVGVCIIGALVLASRLRGRSRWQPPVLAALVVADLLAAGRMANPMAAREALTDVPALARLITTSGEPGRLYRDTVPTGVALRAPTNDPIHRHRWNLEILNFYLSWSYRIPTVYHTDYDRLAGSRIRALTERVAHLPWPDRVPLLSAAAVRWVLTHQRLDLPELELVTAVPNPSNVVFHLYRNLAVAPMVTFVTSARYAPTTAEAIDVMLEPGFDPRSTVVVEGDPAAAPAVEDGRTVGTTEPGLTVVRHGPNSWSVAARTPISGWVVFSDGFDPGWRVTLDGVPAPHLRANGAFSAVWVPAGEHRVERRYRPYLIGTGAAVSLLSLIVLVTVVFGLGGRLLSAPAAPPSGPRPRG